MTAKRTVLRDPEPETDGEEALEPLSDVEERQLSQVQEIVRGLSSSAESVVRVSLRLPDHSLVYYGQMPVEGFSEQALQERFGGGKFVCGFYHPVDGQLVYHKSVTVRVAGPTKDPRQVRVARLEGDGKADEPASGGDDVDMRIRIARLEGQLEGMKGIQAAPAPMDPVTMMEKLSTLQRNTMPAPVAPPDPLAAIDRIVGAVEKIVGVGRDIAPEHPGTDWSRVVDRGVDAVSELIQEARAQRGVAPPAAPPGPALPPGTEAMPAWQREVLAWVPRLVGRARDGKDAELAADVMLEDLSAPTLAALVPASQVAGFAQATVEQLRTLVPETVPHTLWFITFLDAVTEALKDDVAPAGGGGAAPGADPDDPAF